MSNKIKNILVTGGCGFIGSTSYVLAGKDGYNVTAGSADINHW